MTAFDGKESASAGAHFTDREGVLELTHNYGTESDPNYKIANGNSEPGKGFGHVCISVDNIQAACKRIEDAGYPFQKKLTDGRMRNIAFAKDPDGYWVEIIGQKPLEETEKVEETETSSYRFNHSMIRVKSQEASLKFYQEIMGMTLMRTSENKDNGFNLYFLGYPGGYDYNSSSNGVNPVAGKEGILELTWNYGTEKEEGKVYHDGNAEPQVSRRRRFDKISADDLLGVWTHLCVGRRPGPSLPVHGREGCDVEEETDRRKNEEYCICARPRRILDRGHSERETEERLQSVREVTEIRRS